MHECNIWICFHVLVKCVHSFSEAFDSLLNMLMHIVEPVMSVSPFMTNKITISETVV